MLDLLFVYGTLLSTDAGPTGRSERERLARSSRMIGAARVEGQLFDLGRYPGLVLSNAGGATVEGELLELSNPVQTLRWLDAYEGIVPGQHEHNEYERREVDVTLENGESARAWTYVYRKAVPTSALITGGRWLRR